VELPEVKKVCLPSGQEETVVLGQEEEVGLLR
jgi:hypothetical protein